MKTRKNQKQISIEEYVKNYCQEKRIRERFAVYVSPKTHHNLRSIARLFASEHHTTTSSLADSIISCHFETHKELLNDTHDEQARRVLEWLNGGSEEPEE